LRGRLEDGTRDVAGRNLVPGTVGNREAKFLGGKYLQRNVTKRTPSRTAARERRLSSRSQGRKPSLRRRPKRGREQCGRDNATPGLRSVHKSKAAGSVLRLVAALQAKARRATPQRVQIWRSSEKRGQRDISVMAFPLVAFSRRHVQIFRNHSTACSRSENHAVGKIASPIPGAASCRRDGLLSAVLPATRDISSRPLVTPESRRGRSRSGVGRLLG
jgi:hypothetical protein